METVIGIGKFLLEHWEKLLSAVVALLSAATAIALIIPGEQPEKFLQSIVDFLAKFSKK